VIGIKPRSRLQSLEYN